MIRILFFGKIADLMGKREQGFELTPDIADIHALRDVVFRDALREGLMCVKDIHTSLNQVRSRDNVSLTDGDEVAFFSVFSGG